jgi:hypothetical protein
MELDMKSLEKRLTTATPLSAYLKTKDDLYFQATVSNITGKINPGAKAVVAVTAELPQGLKGTDLDLMIGQAVSSGTGKDVSADGYIRVAKMELPDENKTVKSTTDGLVIQPYTIGLSNFKLTGLISDTVPMNVTFDYTLAKSVTPGADPTTFKHKLVVEIIDPLSNINTLAFALDVTGTTPGLKVGKDSLSIPIGIPIGKVNEFMNSFGSSKSFSIKIYDEYKEGYRRLLGTTSGTWLPKN